jgi:hypothetical protein
MKKYTRRKGRSRQQRQTRSKKYSRRRLRYGGVYRGSRAQPSRTTPSSATPSKATPSRASTRSASAKPTPGKVVIRNSVPVSHSRGRTPSRAPSRAPPKTSLRNAGISKDDAEALQAARIISNFPYDMDKFLDMVIKNYELLNYEGVKLALREKISINEDPAVGRLSTNGILFISYICGKLVCLLNELSTLPKSKVDKKRSLLYRIKQIERVICLLDGVGCSWGIRPYSKTEMDNIAEYYRKIKDDAGLQEYHQQLNEFINKYFPVLTKYTDPSHVVSSSMCRRLIPGNIIHRLSTIGEEE